MLRNLLDLGDDLVKALEALTAALVELKTAIEAKFTEIDAGTGTEPDVSTQTASVQELTAAVKAFTPTATPAASAAGIATEQAASTSEAPQPHVVT